MNTRRLRPANVVPEVVKSPSMVTRPAMVRLAPRAVRLKVGVPSPNTTSRLCPPTSMVCRTASPVVLARTITLAEASKPGIPLVVRVPLRKPAKPVPASTRAPVTSLTSAVGGPATWTAPPVTARTVTAALPATALRWKTKEPDSVPSDPIARPPDGTVTATLTKEPAGRAALPEPTGTVVATGRVLTSIRPDRSASVSVDGSVKWSVPTSRAPAIPSAAMTRPPLMSLAETKPPRSSAAPVTVTVVPVLSRCTQIAPVSFRPWTSRTTEVPPTRTLADPARVSTSAETVPVRVTPGTLTVTRPVMVPTTPSAATVRSSEAPEIVSAPPPIERLAPLTVIVVAVLLRVTVTSPVSRWPRTSMARPLPPTRR